MKIFPAVAFSFLLACSGCSTPTKKTSVDEKELQVDTSKAAEEPQAADHLAEKERVTRIIHEKLADPAADIAHMRKSLRETARGAEIDDFCSTNNIGMTYALTLSMIYAGEEGGYDFTRDSLVMMPSVSNEKTVLTMFHEYRHSWQDKALKAFDVLDAPIAPEDKWALLRFLEADGFAYSIYAYAERMVQKGMTTLDEEIAGLDEARLICETRDHLKTKGPMTFAEYRSQVFEPCLAMLRNYDGRQMAYIQSCVHESEKALLNPSLERIDSLYNAMQQAPDKKDIERILRGLGGLDLDLSAPTCLQDTNAVTRETLFNVYPFMPRQASALDARRDSTLKAEAVKFDTHMQNLDRLSQSLHR